MEFEAIIILISFLIGYSVDNLWAFIQKKLSKDKKNYKKFIVKRIRIHHNLFGYVLIIFSLFFYPIILMPAGLGMISGHKIRDNLFKFFEFLGKEIREEIKKEAEVTKQDIEKGKRKIKRVLE